MKIDAFLRTLRTELGRLGQCVHLETIPARTAVYGELMEPLSGPMREALLRRGIERLYAHQAEAVNVARAGKHVVVVTGTASGKTLCYNIPVLEAVMAERRSRALYIFPTKALAQDQLGKLREFELPQPLKAATYDGDTPSAERRAIKKTAQIVLTNPDMLHVGILPYHTTWADFFRNLKYVVVDEIHSYRGIFGSHVGNILRRLRRICEQYGSKPQFICASATIANPEVLMSNLTALDAHIVKDDASPSGEKAFIFWNPPFLAEVGERRSPSSEATSIFAELVRNGIRSIVFTQSRKQAELLYAYTKAKLSEKNEGLADKIMAYRAGYRPEDRREIERRLFKGELLGVTSTTALELGVDIGGLDAAVLTGYPGTIAGTWQQAGRAGRGRGKSLAVLIAMDNPLDQFLMHEPDYFFRETPESAIIDTQNPYVLSSHALCAAYEMPLTQDDVDLFGERLYEVLAVLGETGQLGYRDGRWYWNGLEYPAKQVNIRSASGDIYEIVDTTTVPEILGTVDSSSAFIIIHPGAVYLHAGESYIVEKLDLVERAAYVRRADVPYYTTPDSLSDVRVEKELVCKPFCAGEARFGDVVVSEHVIGYRRHKLFGEGVIGRTDLDLPPQVFSTEAVWMTIPQQIVNKVIGRNLDFPGAIHAIEHASIGILPLFAMCDRRDIGGVSSAAHPDVGGQAGIFIYDAYPGGAGIARTAYERLDELLESTLQAIERCSCESGCPSCVQSPKCGSNNEPLDKAGAAFLLRELLACSAAPRR